MFEKFGDYMFHLLHTPLKKGKKSGNQFYIFFKVAGSLFDDTKEDFFRIRKEASVLTASEVMLKTHGQDRDMIRYKNESFENYRRRLLMKSIIAEMAGSEAGVRLALNSLGFQNVVIEPYWQYDSERWAEFIAKITLDIDEEAYEEFAVIKQVVRKVKQASAKDNYWFIYIVEMDSKDLECFKISNINNKFEMLWWDDFLTLDGRWKLDGEKKLDGIRSKMCFHSGSGMKFQIPEEFHYTGYQGFQMDLRGLESWKATSTSFRWELHFWNHLRILNGKWLLDGSYLLDSARSLMDTSFSGAFSIQTNHTIKPSLHMAQPIYLTETWQGFDAAYQYGIKQKNHVEIPSIYMIQPIITDENLKVSGIINYSQNVSEVLEGTNTNHRSAIPIKQEIVMQYLELYNFHLKEDFVIHTNHRFSKVISEHWEEVCSIGFVYHSLDDKRIASSMASEMAIQVKEEWKDSGLSNANKNEVNEFWSVGNLFDGRINNSLSQKVSSNVKMENKIKESIEAESVSIQSGYWLLDGNWSLDGSRYLKAKKWEEKL